MDKLMIRPGRKADIAPLDALLARSYPALLAADYPPSILVTAIPRISKAQPRLVTGGSYFLAFRGDRLVGAGGWTRAVPGGGGRGRAQVGHVRHFVTDAGAVRQGVGRAVMDRVLSHARAGGIELLECFSTRTAVPFYESSGFRLLGEIDVDLAPGITFPALHMRRNLGP